MEKQAGFTLVEIVIFIVVTGILAATLLLAFTTSFQKTPTFIENLIANQTAKQCMDWFVGQRSLNGYSSISCPSTTVPPFCTVPSGYTLSVSVSCAAINGDASYQTITVTVNGNSSAALTTLIANY